MKKTISMLLTILWCVGLCACTSVRMKKDAEILTSEKLPECVSAENDGSLELSKSEYAGTTIKVSDDKPYWGMLVTNNGNSEIQVDIGADDKIVLVKPEQSVWIYYEPFFKEGSYPIGFSSKDTLEMDGTVKFWLAADKESVIPKP